MTLGEHILLIRKKKSLSQADLGKAIGTSGDIIGRYERDDMTPSIEVVSKIADTLDVSLDFLVGKTDVEMDKATLRRLRDIQKLPDDGKAFVFNILDMILRDYKTKKNYAGKI